VVARASVGDAAGVHGRPTVLLANLAPMAQLGLARMLADAGVRAVDGDRRPHRLVDQARVLRPDVVVVGLGQGAGRALAARVRAAVPGAKIILWPRDEERMEVLRQGAGPRSAPARPDALLDEVRAGA
jgi:hypothetical protein